METQSGQTKTVPVTDEDIRKLENTVASMPDSANAHYNLGLALAQRGEWDKSLDEFRAALTLKPGLLEARVNMAGILLQKGDYDGCIDESLRALEFRPDLIEGCINIGIAFTHKGMLDQAVQSFEKALAIDADSIIAHLNLGNAFLALGDIDKSIEHNTRAVELDPSSGLSHNNLSVALYHKGDLEQARRHAKEAIELGYKIHLDFLENSVSDQVGCIHYGFGYFQEKNLMAAVFLMAGRDLNRLLSSLAPNWILGVFVAEPLVILGFRPEAASKNGPISEFGSPFTCFFTKSESTDQASWNNGGKKSALIHA